MLAQGLAIDNQYMVILEELKNPYLAKLSRMFFIEGCTIGSSMELLRVRDSV